MKKKTILCTLMILCLTCSLFSGCGSNQPSAASSESVQAASVEQEKEAPAQPSQEPEVTAVASEVEAESSAEPEDSLVEPRSSISFPLEEPAEFTIALSVAPFAGDLIKTISDWSFFREMELRTNVHFEGLLFPAFTTTDNFNLLLASGDYPDVMSDLDSNSSTGNLRAYEEDIIINLTDYISDYAPLLQAYLDEHPDILTELAYVDSNSTQVILNFPTVHSKPSLPNDVGLQYRGDWLESLDMDVPETTSEFLEVVKAFHSEYGAELFIGPSPEDIPITNAMNIRINYDEFGSDGASFPLYQIDDEVTCGLLQDEFLEYLKIANDLYRTGCLNPEFYNSMAKYLDFEPDRALNGEVGIYTAELSTYRYVNNGLKDSGSDGYVVLGPNIVNDNHDDTHLGRTKSLIRNRCWVISSACAHPEIVAAWVDYLYSDEGYELYNYGVEGEGLEYDSEGNPHMSELVTHNPDGLAAMAAEYLYTVSTSSHVPGIVNPAKYLDGYSEEDVEALNIWLDSTGGTDWKIPHGVTLDPEEKARYDAVIGDLMSYINEMNLSFVTGAKSLDEFDAYREELKALGVETVIEVYQTAYDRYMERLEQNQ